MTRTNQDRTQALGLRVKRISIPIRSPKEEPPSEQLSPITSLGYNPTQHSSHRWAASHGKPTPRGAESQIEATPSQQKRLTELGAPPSPTEVKEQKEQKCEGDKAPQPIAVDGCGDVGLRKETRATTPGLAAELLDSPPFDPALTESGNAKGDSMLPQPVAVDGCGGSSFPVVKGRSDSLPITPTLAWTEKPIAPSEKLVSDEEEVLPGSTEGKTDNTGQLVQLIEESKKHDITDDELKLPGSNLKQNGNGHQNVKEQSADNKPWVSALTACQILASIPEGDLSLSSDAAAVASHGDNKPKALPLSVSQAARQGLAKIATPGVMPKQPQSHQSGYVHGLTVANVPTLLKPRCQETLPQGNGLPGNFNTAQRVFPENGRRPY